MTITETRARIKTITPEIATELLAKNVNNRKLHAGVVRGYARDMKNGAWKFNGDSICFDQDGNLLDGQHRLMAVIEADTSIDMLILDNIDSSAQSTMDQGRKRTVADALAMRGVKNANLLGAAMRHIRNWEAVDIVANGFYKATNAETLDVLVRRPELEDVISATNAVHSQRWIPRAPFAAFYYLISQVNQHDADSFMNKLAKGIGLSDDDPVLHCRNRLITASTTDAMVMPITAQIALITKAWNGHKNGDSVKQLRLYKNEWTTAADFPRIYGLEPYNA